MSRKISVILSMCLCLLMITGVLVGCQTQQPSPSASPATEQKTPEATTEAPSPDPNTEHLRFTLFYPWSSTIKTSDEVTDPSNELYDERWKTILDKFNLSIDYVLADGGTMVQTLRTQIAAGDMSDVMLASGITVQEYKDYGEQSALKFLPPDALDKYPNIKRNIMSLSAPQLFQASNGQYVCLPRSLDRRGVNSDYFFMMIYRKDLALQAGIQPMDACTPQQLFDMYTTIHQTFPDMPVFSSIWPTAIYQLGLWTCSPEALGFYLDKNTGKYEYGPSLPETLEGIKWYKKFYDAGFMPKDFLNTQAYGATAEFSTGKLFSYFNGADVAFLSSIRTMFKTDNPSMDPAACVDTFLLTKPDGTYLMHDWGNGSGEYVFSPKMDDAKFARILSLFDYLMSDEGVALCNYGVEGKDYVNSGDKLVSIRQKDANGNYIPFSGADKLGVPCILQAVVPQSDIAEANPHIDEATRTRVAYLFKLRMDQPHYIQSYDAKMMMYTSEPLKKCALDSMGEINKLIIQESAETIEAAWQKWLDDNKPLWQAALDDLNANLLNK